MSAPTSFTLVDDFEPSWWLRDGHAQSVLPSLPLRGARVEARARALRAASRELLLDCGAGVRLQAFHASQAHRGRPAAGAVVVLLHGWEGSADSFYILSLGAQLFELGYEVVRLNLRDHGATHHLNQEIFHSCRLPEVVGAVQAIQREFSGRRLALVGFSLGGNFMLRVAAEAPRAGLLHSLARVIGISPVLHPATTLDALENGWTLYQRYFVLKWTRSLLRKQAAWPGVYELEPLLGSKDLRRMTADLVRTYTEYPDLHTYLEGYAITGRRLADLEVPTLILTALDDPIIPARDLERLARSDSLQVLTTRHGGHCGYLQTLGGPSWTDRVVSADLLRCVPP